jgi:hypothetical protein
MAGRRRRETFALRQMQNPLLGQREAEARQQEAGSEAAEGLNKKRAAPVR